MVTQFSEYEFGAIAAGKVIFYLLFKFKFILIFLLYPVREA